jgi:hypothetical protein
MNFTAKTALLSTALVLMMTGNQANAAVKAQLVVRPLSPHYASSDAEDLMLHSVQNGSTYLYVEQEQGAMLSVFDVTNPAHMRLEASIETGAHEAFDFAGAVGDNELIVFRDGSGDATLDLHRAKAPRLMIDGRSATTTELLGTSGYLASTFQPIAPVASEAQSVQVVATTAAASPRVVSTVSDVTRRVSRPETGTIFLLGQRGVTVVRQVDVERRYQASQAVGSSAS